jgi:Bacterial SH3 domain
LNELIASKHFLMHLVLLVCVLTAACAPRSTPTPTNEEAQIVPSSALTLYIMPTPPPSPTAVCPGAPRGRLILRERGRVLPDDPRPINLRSAPGTSNTVLVQIPIRAVFYVLEGPTCADNFAWYKIRYLGREGWIAEGDLSSYYVEPYLPG